MPSPHRTAESQPAAEPAAPARLGQCAACHGRDGRSTIANVPDLAGRDAAELLDAMAAYLDGRRDYPPMRAMLGPIRVEEREALANWYARQPGPPPS
ncbi:MAG: cytochrome C [Xanthomonadales bacterium]|nr:cytochrome C [Xanthomonadales bacterium]